MIRKLIEVKQPRSGQLRFLLKFVVSFVGTVLLIAIFGAAISLSGVELTTAAAVATAVAGPPYVSWLLLSEDIDFRWEQFRADQPLRRSVIPYAATCSGADSATLSGGRSRWT